MSSTTEPRQPLYAQVLTSPLLWGMAATAGFFQAIRQPRWHHPLLQRYCDGHIINRLEVLFFFVGVAALGLTWLGLRWQRRVVRDLANAGSLLPGEQPAEVSTWQALLQSWPRWQQESLAGQRIAAALQFVTRTQSVEALRAELRELAAASAETQLGKSAFVKIIIWAIPILGFLGTVVGITVAVSELSPEALENSMDKVTAGLAVAFDTTAIGLVLSMILMFGQYVNDQLTVGLLNALEGWAEQTLLGRVLVRLPEESEEEKNFHLLRRTAERLVHGIRESVELQRQNLHAVLAQERQHWQDNTSLLLAKLESAWDARSRQTAEHTIQAMQQLHHALLGEQQSLSSCNQEVWTAQQAAFKEQAFELARHTEALLRALRSVDEIGGLETALNRNLKALSGATHFESILQGMQTLLKRLDSAERPLLTLRSVEAASRDQGLAA